jgi:hypothetical protein
MAIHKRYLGLAALLACVAGSIVGPAQSQEDGIYWYGDYQQALKKAKETGKPIFLEFRCEA